MFVSFLVNRLITSFVGHQMFIDVSLNIKMFIQFGSVLFLAISL